MLPRILERDTHIIDWPTAVAWCTTTGDPAGGTHTVRSDGLVGADYKTMTTRALTGAIAAGTVICNGVHLAGPMTGAEFTPYAISVMAMAEDNNVRPYLFIAESPATITSDAGGDACAQVRYLAFGDGPETYGGKLNADMIIAVTEKTADRNICIGVAMLAGTTGGATNGGLVQLSVRRLIGPGPRVVDVRKQ